MAFLEVLDSEVPDVEELGQVLVEVVAPGHHCLGGQCQLGHPLYLARGYVEG